MQFVSLSRDQASHFLDLLESFRKGEITRRSLRGRLKMLEDGEHEQLWELFLTRFDTADESAWDNN